MTVVAFVDVDNCSDLGRRASTRGDALTALSRMASRAAALVHLYFSEAREVQVRLYGGWVSQRGTMTPLAENLIAAGTNVRRAYSGVVVVPKMIYAPAQAANVNLSGTHVGGNPGSQKMVDTTLVLDLGYFSRAPGHRLILLSDDQDMVPGLLVAAKSAPVVWDRRHRAGSFCNDDAVLAAGVHLVVNEE